MDSKGVSEVIGALMLILVVVVAVSAFGYYLAIVQKEEMERETHLRFVKNENLSLANLELSPNNLFEIVNKSSGEVYEISLKCDAYCQFQLCNQSCERIEIYGELISRKMNATLEPGKIILEQNGNWEVKIAEWKTLNLTIRNLNIHDSMLVAIKLNGEWIKDWEVDGVVYNHTNPLRIPAGSAVKISANIDSLGIKKDQGLEIELVSGVYNIFTFHFTPPSIEFEVGVKKENYGSYEREVLKFLSTNPKLLDLIWLFYIKNSNGILIIPIKSSSITYAPENIILNLNQGEICSYDLHNFSFQVIGIDTNGIMSFSEIRKLKANEINPPAVIKANKNENTITVRIEDIFGCPKSNEIVFFIPMGNVSLNKTVSLTNSDGSTAVALEGSGIVTVKCRNLVKHLEIE